MQLEEERDLARKDVSTVTVQWIHLYSLFLLLLYLYCIIWCCMYLLLKKKKLNYDMCQVDSFTIRILNVIVKMLKERSQVGTLSSLWYIAFSTKRWILNIYWIAIFLHGLSHLYKSLWFEQSLEEILCERLKIIHSYSTENYLLQFLILYRARCINPLFMS